MSLKKQSVYTCKSEYCVYQEAIILLIESVILTKFSLCFCRAVTTYSMIDDHILKVQEPS